MAEKRAPAGIDEGWGVFHHALCSSVSKGFFLKQTALQRRGERIFKNDRHITKRLLLRTDKREI